MPQLNDVNLADIIQVVELFNADIQRDSNMVSLHSHCTIHAFKKMFIPFFSYHHGHTSPAPSDCTSLPEGDSE